MFAKSYKISDRLMVGNNSFGLIRLLAACAVVFSHAWTVTGGLETKEPLRVETGFTLGWHAVSLFFALSGLLVAGSLHHCRSIIQFAWSRFLRIFPALMMIMLMTLIASAVLVDTFMWQLSAILEYLVKNVALFGANATLPGVFENNPIPYELNIPLWTLKYEVLMYVSLALLSFVSWKYEGRLTMKSITVIILLSTGCITLFFDVPENHGRIDHIVRFLFSFYLGVAVWLWRDSIHVSGVHFLLFSCVNFGLLFIGVHLIMIQIIWLGYCALWFGTRRYGWLSRVTDRQDYSYGIYIIGFPVQQMVLAYTGLNNPWLNFVMSLTIVLFLSACSWNLIEQPALRFKKVSFLRGK